MNFLEEAMTRNATKWGTGKGVENRDFTFSLLSFLAVTQGRIQLRVT